MQVCILSDRPFQDTFENAQRTKLNKWNQCIHFCLFWGFGLKGKRLKTVHFPKLVYYSYKSGKCIKQMSIPQY